MELRVNWMYRPWTEFLRVAASDACRRWDVLTILRAMFTEDGSPNIHGSFCDFWGEAW